ncbi:cyclic nucleotide-binding domain-containing protein [endosymbiont 'TC1' of Trimyema compressum]|uniref:cyclic nucleotide-binding domain-containing protein n=1 Tax=endosymbiont 'TC1' of Trimyema compressum TaxID=243899 RepID=UPI001FDF0832|nr:cyclic nucleotide-binding domain-containing protein [endosymbiont 'TC1' of Trimyema compressum]
MLEEVLVFWKNLSEKEKATINNNTTLLNYKKGESIHSPLNECTGFIVVQKGILRVYILSEEGKEITLFRVNKARYVFYRHLAC